MEGCIFCKIVAGEIPSSKVYEDEHVLAFKDLNPVAPTHVLVIPKEHVESVGAFEESHRALAGNVMLAIPKVAEALGVTQFRTVANTGAEAGQSVFHLHLHILAGRPFSWPPG
jgi:histidine triad (HIT) family protein